MTSSRMGTGAWISLMEYSVKKGISLSTLRRYIKARKVEFRIEEGRYLLFDESAGNETTFPSGLASTVSQLERDLKTAREEIAELKTLIALYEETPRHGAQALER
jgi:hypothetical protein